MLHVLALITATLAASITSDGDVLVLDDSSIGTAIKKYDFLLVEFYAQWCGHCKAFAPEYQQLGTDVKNAGLKIAVAKFDGGSDQKIALTKYKVESFPTILLLVKGHAVPYTGGRTANEVLQFLTQSQVDRHTVLPNVLDVQSHLQTHQTSVVFFGSGEKRIAEFSIVAKTYPEIQFAVTGSADARKLYDVDENHVVLFKNHEEKRHEFGVINAGLADWIEEQLLPSFEELSNPKLISESKVIFLLWDSASIDIKEEIRVLAGEIKKRYTVVSVHSENPLLPQLLRSLQVNAPVFPSLYYQRAASYVYELFNITIENTMRLVHQANSNVAQRKLKSQNEPRYQEKLIQVVGTSFQTEVLDSKQDVFVQFCDSLDEQCFQGEFEELAEEVENVKIAYVEMKFNDIEGLTFEKYPQFKLYKKMLKSNPIAFDAEDASKDNLLTFLQKHTDLSLRRTDL